MMEMLKSRAQGPAPQKRGAWRAMALACALGVIATASPANAAPVCVANSKAKIKGGGQFIVPVPADEVDAYRAKGFSTTPCPTTGATPTVIRDRICQLNAQLPPALGDKLAANFGATPAILCASATKAMQ